MIVQCYSCKKQVALPITNIKLCPRCNRKLYPDKDDIVRESKNQKENETNQEKTIGNNLSEIILNFYQTQNATLQILLKISEQLDETNMLLRNGLYSYDKRNRFGEKNYEMY